MPFINCTPHPTNLIGEHGSIILPKADTVPRCSCSVRVIETVDGIPITETIFGEVQNLPDPQEGVFYIVSKMIISACPQRKDLLFPGKLIRDEWGNIVGVATLARS